MIANPAIEQMSREDMSALQLKKLKNLKLTAFKQL